MLRCPPTTIVLGQRDLLEYDRRKKHRRELDADTVTMTRELSCVAVDNPPRAFGPSHRWDEADLLKPFSVSSEETSILSPTSEPDVVETTSSLLHDTIEADFSIENPNRSPEPQSSPMKNDFDYGGFVESPMLQNDDTPRRSSPFLAPEDSSTPQHPDARRIRNRPLPRSPLFLSQNATSPDGRVTTQLTPRVLSRVASHNSPGIIFAQPPRRPPRSSPRTLRHQTNSFSFDSSERASAAYEQERVISNSTDDTPHPSEDIRLHDELRGSSLQSSRVSSGVAISHETQGDIAIFDSEQEIHFTTLLSLSSPSVLPLPPPFSSVSRRTSNAESLPSTTNEHLSQDPTISPARSHASTPNRDRARIPWPQRSLNASPVAETSETNESPPSAGRIGNFINRIRNASYRARSPLHRNASSDVPTATLTTDQSRTPGTANPQTPSRNYRVYNDALSPDTQPQTPANLPEARHQSRYHASYTAPVTRNAARIAVSSISSTHRVGSRGPDRQHALYTPVRAARRPDSPSGMRDEGFEGLYGGRENGDEEQLWVEGVRFNNAETRLWGERDARNNGGALRETPEPEDWRVGRRN
ncbi:uncharacterized protein LY89DRAFT_727811 [Mollisia scopiformis]|uniref:Uncharacterized protein n=1 Tax=Mollisia scopiformis TaxID=149040 RepID=A0A194XRV5_MOLSC|nr:uncharacterized protein LY89DRAFT_727811 [Mollisia scopiformis]KUJ23025.1 hypothetical protein LY89DRAFT_727811 [Mollisia scopiformis]